MAYRKSYRERKLNKRLQEHGYYLGISPAKTEGTAVWIGSDHGLYQIMDGKNVVAGSWFNMSLDDVEQWIDRLETAEELEICGWPEDE